MRHSIGLLAALATAVAAPASAAAQTTERTLAIASFVNLSGEAADDWIGDGIVETAVADLERLDSVAILESEALVAAIGEELRGYADGGLPPDPAGHRA